MSGFAKMLAGLPPRVRAVAEALARAHRKRSGQPASAESLGGLSHQPALADQFISDARAALDAADAVAPLQAGRRPHGPLSVDDAEGLGRSTDAGTLLILARDRRGRASAVVWAISAVPAALAHEEAHPLWRAAAGVLTQLPDAPPDEPAQETQP